MRLVNLELRVPGRLANRDKFQPVRWSFAGRKEESVHESLEAGGDAPPPRHRVRCPTGCIDFVFGLAYTDAASMNAMPSASLQQILQELRVGLMQLYGSRLKSLVLFGSYARGQADEGSDIDVALILDTFAYASQEIEHCIEFVAGLSLKYDCVISIIPIRERDWLTRQTPFLMNVRREAVPVS